MLPSSPNSASTNSQAQTSQETIKNWPNPNFIDLNIHDLPHDYSSIEWWYQNAHLKGSNGKNYSFFSSFFRLAIGKKENSNDFNFAHSLTWAFIDETDKKYWPVSFLSSSAPYVGLKTIENGDNKRDELLQNAVKEIFGKNTVPLPDKIFKNEPELANDQLHLKYDRNIFYKDNNGHYHLELHNEEKALTLKLKFEPQMSPVRHGDNGEVKGTAGEDMFYYFIPMNKVSGTLIINDELIDLNGTGWYDHEFAKEKKSIPGEDYEVDLLHDIAWNWVSLQLDNGSQLSAYDLFDVTNNNESAGKWAVYAKSKDETIHPTGFDFIPQEYWTSSRTFTKYPISWKLSLPEHGIDLNIKAVFEKQEFITLISEPAFWEGKILAEGTVNGKPVSGKGFIEISGFGNVRKMEDFFKAVTKETRKAINKLLPLNPTDEEFINLVASMDRAHFLNGLDKEQFVNKIIVPIREIIDRGGKCWRSYAALACIDAVGGDSQPFMDWLVWPELLHTGSLIIDDVQDKSEIRRGGPACHITHGEAIAINAGNACYFLGQVLLLDDRLPINKKLKVYELYFETMRSAHAGQAMDISSFSTLIPDIIKNGNVEELERRVLSVHRLKSAVPASMLARLGAIKGDGTEDQINALGDFFESLGLAFQIIDDVLNLKGFEKDLKDKGEDITAGKITMPVVKAFGKLDQEKRQWLWDKLEMKSSDINHKKEVIDLLNQCGAIDDCQKHAEDLIENNWSKMDHLIPDSDVKIKLRAFSKYVLNRHY